MFPECTQNSTRIDIEHLNETCLVTSDNQFAVLSERGGIGDILEPGNRLFRLVCFRGIDLNACGGGNGKVIRCNGREVNRRYSTILLDQNGRLYKCRSITSNNGSLPFYIIYLELFPVFSFWRLARG